MPTHAELAARLLREAAGFLRTFGEQSPTSQAEMEEYAIVFERVAILVEQDPTGIADEEGDEPPPD